MSIRDGGLGFRVESVNIKTIEECWDRLDEFLGPGLRV